MRYKNIKTGAIVDSSSIIKSEDWKPINELKSEEPKPTEEYIEEEIDLEEMSKAELVALAKEHKIEVNEKDTKDKIIATIAKAFE